MDNPRWQAVYDRSTERIIGRLKKGTDLFTGIKEICRQFGVTAGQFQCMGSLTYATFHQVAKGEVEGTIVYSPKVRTSTEVELISGLGFIGVDAVTNDLEIHFHGSFVDCFKKIDGGHFVEGENVTAITIEFMIHVMKNTVVKRRIDEEFNVPFFQFEEREGAN
ncbi:PPC domain-containing DNA-binding protein [Solibacillus sp. CAU 1738]|uniref:PPC domain-containing DNA-binding protein n=1 Tax=Solibacillus sp. CAU 1738 TaxID=3140363 RepID=UPI0032612BE7